MTSSSRDEEMLRGIEEMEVELDAGGNAGNAGFSLCIAKFRCAHFFAMIAKFSYHSENFRYHSESYCA